MQDVIVIGGSYAGMAAALQLLRARRKVTVVDAGERRNRFAGQSHGFLGQDGVDPALIWSQARDQLLAYPPLTWIRNEACGVSGQRDGFQVDLAAGDPVQGRRLLFASGVKDQLPEIPGLAERWGKSVFHCPYCHGYELDQGRIGVIATGPMSLHQAQLLPEWGAVTFLTQGLYAPDAAARADLARRGAEIETTPVARLSGHADLELTDGRVLQFAGLFTATRTSPASPLAEDFGCAMTETPMGRQILTGDSKETTIPGVFACGDTARAPHSVSLAVGDGAWAGAQIHRSLVWPEG
ncbi:NAD(P)/FAD-dependent oxidoreductase [Gemmobacter sp. 24YEA27]|uniref:NAD(P)/FAD-dependent oxidoreductase n=1 Tax=Gemmobacter sp. 24YEA27 TaxID=3040672 RepID=UPI0024B34972|nr:NAD(P)/FAD-dependent oxidoreductase [Gemmobacter sp. 24YEA27]